MKKILSLAFLAMFCMLLVIPLGCVTYQYDIKRGGASYNRYDYEEAIVRLTNAINSGELTQHDLA